MANSRPKLTLISGSRAELELQALRSIPTNFEAFLRITRALQRPANAQLQVVEPDSQATTYAAVHQPSADQ